MNDDSTLILVKSVVVSALGLIAVAGFWQLIGPRLKIDRFRGPVLFVLTLVLLCGVALVVQDVRSR